MSDFPARSERELTAILLAGVRSLQGDLEEGCVRPGVDDILDGVEALSPGELDEVCEEINCGGISRFRPEGSDQEPAAVGPFG